MPIVQQIDTDMTAAMKARDADLLSALRLIKTALKLRQTELPAPMDDGEAIKVLNTLLNQRVDAAQQYRAANHEDRALKEEAEAKIIQSYMPAAATQEEMARAVEETIAELGASSMKDMGAVMKAVRPRLEGKTIDGKTLSELVKSKLSG